MFMSAGRHFSFKTLEISAYFKYLILSFQFYDPCLNQGEGLDYRCYESKRRSREDHHGRECLRRARVERMPGIAR